MTQESRRREEPRPPERRRSDEHGLTTDYLRDRSRTGDYEDDPFRREPQLGQEQRSPTGKPMVPATPLDVIHIRLGSYGLVFCFAVLVLSIVTGLWWLTALVVLLSIFIVVDMTLAYRRQNKLGGGPKSEG